LKTCSRAGALGLRSGQENAAHQDRLAEAKTIGTGVYEIKVRVENTGFLPYPTAMAGATSASCRSLSSWTARASSSWTAGSAPSFRRSRLLHPDRDLDHPVGQAVKIDIKAETQIAWRDARSVSLGGVK